jgi:hypothetical protein
MGDEVRHIPADIKKLGDDLKAEVQPLLDEVDGLLGIGQKITRSNFTAVTGTEVLNYQHYALAVAYVAAIELAGKDLESKKKQLHDFQADLHLTADNHQAADDASRPKTN